MNACGLQALRLSLSSKYANQSLFTACLICDIRRMKVFVVSSAVLLSLSLGAIADTPQKLYRWVDEDGVVHFGDSIPAKAAELEKQVLNEHGVTVDIMRGKKTAAEIAEEKRQEEIRLALERQNRADQALLATYLSVDEIVMHRDRRIELFQAQTRVTELYLRNQRRRLQGLQDEAANYRPYSSDPDAPMIERDLVDDIAETKEVIARHEGNLARFQEDEQQIINRFDGDIDRFKILKGLN